VHRGESRTVRARYLVACDGARSIVREGLGIKREIWPFRGAWLTFDATRKRALPNFFGISPNGSVAAIFCAPEGRAHSIIPLGIDHVRFNFEIEPDTPSDGVLHLEVAFSLLKSTSKKAAHRVLLPFRRGHNGSNRCTSGRPQHPDDAGVFGVGAACRFRCRSRGSRLRLVPPGLCCGGTGGYFGLRFRLGHRDSLRFARRHPPHHLSPASAN
jgi:2-polyprenyl-6-methoxyphenol hydroxylase-like FAD-dependent oxidoreductase